MKSKINQRQKVLDYINKWGSITSYQAYLDLGITQLATRIKELKEEGYIFTDEWVSKKNRDGVIVTFKKYMLLEIANENHISGY